MLFRVNQLIWWITQFDWSHILELHFSNRSHILCIPNTASLSHCDINALDICSTSHAIEISICMKIGFLFWLIACLYSWSYTNDSWILPTTSVDGGAPLWTEQINPFNCWRSPLSVCSTTLLTPKFFIFCCHWLIFMVHWIITLLYYCLTLWLYIMHMLLYGFWVTHMFLRGVF